MEVEKVATTGCYSKRKAKRISSILVSLRIEFGRRMVHMDRSLLSLISVSILAFLYLSHLNYLCNLTLSF